MYRMTDATNEINATDLLATRWAMLLRTRKRDGSWVETPVNVAVEGDRAYFGTPVSSGKVKRIRNFEQVEVAPCTPRGKVTGPAFKACARLLQGEEAEAALGRLRRRYPFVYRVPVPLEHLVKRTHGVVYEVSGFSPVA
jgi:PPOX class probable F420-dependent enzyme